MIWHPTLRPALACALLLLSVGGAVAEERQVWTATCTKAGRTVYRERIADKPSPSKELEVARRNPGAVCLMLAPEEAGSGMTADLAAALQQSRPGASLGPVLSFASPNAPLPDAGIDAALRAIKGVGLPMAPMAARIPDKPQEPLRIGVELSTDFEPPVARPVHSDWVRIALYRDATEDDALADWARILSAQPVLASYTPSLSHLPGGQMMLALGPVASRDSASLCLSVGEIGLDCIAGTGPTSVPEEGAALRALSLSYPGHVTWGGAEGLCRRGEPEAEPEEGPSCAGGPLRPVRRWVDLTAVGTGRPAQTAPAQRGPKLAAGSSSSALASNLETSFSISPKVRPASALRR